MSGWDKVRGHAVLRERLRRAVERGRLASSFLFAGPAGIGKCLFARRAAQSLLCERHAETELDFCGECQSCQQVEAETHPDLLVVRKPADRANLPVELLIGRGDNRMREGLCYDISMRPSRGKRKIAIIDDADFLFEEGANCLLKTLEEPPPHSLILLIGTSAQRQLPTIRSRCQSSRFGRWQSMTLPT